MFISPFSVVRFVGREYEELKHLSVHYLHHKLSHILFNSYQILLYGSVRNADRFFLDSDLLDFTYNSTILFNGMI